MGVNINTGMQRTLISPKTWESLIFFILKFLKKYLTYLCSLKKNLLADFPLFYFTGIEFAYMVQQVCNVTYPFVYLLSRQRTHLRSSISFFVHFLFHCWISIHEAAHTEASSKGKRVVSDFKTAFYLCPNSQFGVEIAVSWKV